jgi:hypothetical protein
MPESMVDLHGLHPTSRSAFESSIAPLVKRNER